MYGKTHDCKGEGRHDEGEDCDEDEDDEDEGDEELYKQFEDEVTSLLALHRMPATFDSANHTDSFAVAELPGAVSQRLFRQLPPRSDLFVELLDFSCAEDEAPYLVHERPHATPRPEGERREPSSRGDRPGPAADGNCYLVLELATETLEQYLRRQTVPLGEEEAQHIFRQACEVVTSLHALGFVHLDLKPSNLMRFPSGRFKLIDMDGLQVAGHTIPICDVICTAKYCAPEVARAALEDDEIAGEESATLIISRLLDVFSLGLVGAELVLRRHPLEAGWQHFMEGEDKDEKGFYRYLCDTHRRVELSTDDPSQQQQKLPSGSGGASKRSELLQDLLLGMLETRPSDRLSMPEVLAHPYFQKGGAPRRPDVQGHFMAARGQPHGPFVAPLVGRQPMMCARGGA